MYMSELGREQKLGLGSNRVLGHVFACVASTNFSEQNLRLYVRLIYSNTAEWDLVSMSCVGAKLHRGAQKVDLLVKNVLNVLCGSLLFSFFQSVQN